MTCDEVALNIDIVECMNLTLVGQWDDGLSEQIDLLRSFRELNRALLHHAQHDQPISIHSRHHHLHGPNRCGGLFSITWISHTSSFQTGLAFALEVNNAT